MDYNINNQQILQAGVYAQQTMHQQQDWRPIDTAPKDGTIIEVRCTYGVAPWYGLYRWTGTWNVQMQIGNKIEMQEMTGSPRWTKVGDDNSSFSEDQSFTWRPYAGQATGYIDPTGGMQDSPAYWRGAVAAKYGLPADHFEKQTQRNAAKEDPKRGFWSRLFSW